MSSFTAFVCAVTGFALVGSTAGAEEFGGIRGAGATSCPVYIQVYRSGADVLPVVSWVYGYWSATNFESIERYGGYQDLFSAGADAEVLKERVSVFCAKNPDAKIIDAAMELLVELPGRTFRVEKKEPRP